MSLGRLNGKPMPGAAPAYTPNPPGLGQFDTAIGAIGAVGPVAPGAMPGQGYGQSAMYNQIDPRAGASTQRGGVISNAGQDNMFTGRNVQSYLAPGNPGTGLFNNQVQAASQAKYNQGRSRF